MATYIFNGECPAGVKQAFIDAYKPANDKLRLVVETTSDYKKSGIYSAERDDTSKPIVIDWGDGTVEQVNGDVSQKVHIYSTVGTFNVVVENIKLYAASANNYTWINTKSQNHNTLKEVVTIPEGVTSIGEWAFSGCSGLTSVTIPNSVTSIEFYAFSGCSGLTSVTIPSSVTSIGDSAFSGCSGLTSVTIPDSVTSIGNYAFINCSGLMSFTVGSSNANYKSVNGLLLSKDGKTLIAGINGNVTIPDGVTDIGDYAFSGCTGLTSVTIPEGVTSIGAYAFYNCSSLTNVMIPDSVTSIKYGAFQACSGLMNVTIGSGVTSIGDSAFSGCSGLTSVTIPNSVTSIGERAFVSCTGMTNVTIGNGVTSIGFKAFGQNDSLTSFTIQKTVSETTAMYNTWFESFSYSSFTVICTDGNCTFTASCFLKDTDILLADGTTKKIEDLTYDDVLKVWDFDEGQLGSAKVCWLTRPGLTSNHYYQLTFDNGTVLKTTGINSNHRIFSVDQGKFTNVCDAKVGDKVFSIDGTLTITDVKYVEEECEYYNVMTSGKINCFANGILTSDRYGNLYPIADMKYVKDGRTIRPYSEYEAVGIDRYWYDNLRLGENTETVEKSKEYVWKCIGQMLPLPDDSQN